MAYVKKSYGGSGIYSYIIHGVMYRVKIVAYNYEELKIGPKDGLDVMVYSLEQSYHKNTPFRNAGTLEYRGVSLKEAWAEVQSLVGKLEMPKDLKSLQPFLTQQI